MNNRRAFLQKLMGLGAGIPLLGMNFPKANSRNQISGAAKLPILLCSRGEVWGKRVLEPAWETLASTNSILDAIEIGANVTELDPRDSSVGYGGGDGGGGWL